jgi:hypothetical protein
MEEGAPSHKESNKRDVDKVEKEEFFDKKRKKSSEMFENLIFLVKS